MQIVIYFHKTGFKKTSFSLEKDAKFLLLATFASTSTVYAFHWNWICLKFWAGFLQTFFSFKLIIFSINAFSLDSRF